MLSKVFKYSQLFIGGMFKCGLDINGVTDEQIKKTYFEVMKIFEKEGYHFGNNIRLLGGGKIRIFGIGRDGRCAFCEYLKKAVVKYFKEAKTKGSIELLECPFNSYKLIDYTLKTIEARRELLKMLANSQNTNK